jgi:hypothetical protein
MPDNISINVYIATHLASSVCSASLKTDDFTPEGLEITANKTLKVYKAIFNSLVESQRQRS